MLKLLLLFVLCTSTANASCELQPAKIVSKQLINLFDVAAITPSSIKFSRNTGNITGKNSVFDFDALYEMDSTTSSARFRIGETFLTKGFSYLGNIEWESGKVLNMPGPYKFYVLKTAPLKASKTLAMIGDSITWWSYGRYFRCMLAPELPGVQFVGPHTDPFGYGHAGEGGNTTKNIIDRLNKIKPTDYYFILAGTNDWIFATPEITINNLKLIAKTLSKRGGKVLISTLLPRLDKHDARNEKVNKAILAWNGKGCNCKVIDLDKEFRKLPDQHKYFWDTGLHPNIEGYQKITEILAPRIRQDIN
ncbi:MULTISPECIES: SGNH/GDSL hydrolase family protein [unclassified Pseudomonas]|uniref:SGNH/GDSL hydrolase family protein n=1 Tax=unclassified Pseudomonas TaxID=196821 RepID=UPI002B228839|nr:MULTISPECIES: SGNH/GDSL hydrolase family protein [unclassified Pseudomonas]MEA9978467.1 SGNH/GDSL hydrolase family protein [Pseudomonas sp. RTS4]MEB0199011.1 SGNH/GDSL hydrolase family protein [Pseudomonas sp. 5S4]MEB0248180.1 SGNH/GDSL hydrolase family protein [Pseudomonas sp. 10S5]